MQRFKLTLHLEDREGIKHLQPINLLSADKVYLPLWLALQILKKFSLASDHSNWIKTFNQVKRAGE